MSNIFKNNSRFAGLVDYDTNLQPVKLIKKMAQKEDDGSNKNQDTIKIPIELKKCENKSNVGFKRDENSFNSFKDNRVRERKYNRPLNDYELQKIREEYKAYDEVKKQEEYKKQEESLKIDNFPELNLHNNENKIYEESYIEKLKSVIEVEPEHTNLDPDLINLKDGWIIMKKDILTGKTIVKGNFEKVKQCEITQKELTQKTIDGLVELHESRSQEYINLNGYDTWEKMFKCTNWQEWEDKYKNGFEDEDEDEDETENEISFDEDMEKYNGY